jgi:hypothetical protein
LKLALREVPSFSVTVTILHHPHARLCLERIMGTATHSTPGAEPRILALTDAPIMETVRPQSSERRLSGCTSRMIHQATHSAWLAREVPSMAHFRTR